MAMVKPLSLTLMIPGLAGFSPEQRQQLIPQLPKLPGLSGLLNQSRRVSSKSSHFEAMLGGKFGLSPQQPLPIAALTYWHDKGHPPSKAMLRADPVYLKVDRDSVYLLGRHNVQVSLDEAESLTAQINSVYSDTLWSIEVGSADRWYISAEEEFNLKTYSINEVFGKNIEPYLPQGPAGKKWRAVLNELQMLLYNSDVNVQRETNRRLPINSVWLWGEGALPQRPTSPANIINYVWSNDPLCLGMAHWAQCRSQNLPATYSEWIEQTQPGQHLIVFDDLRILATEDYQSWESMLIKFDEMWLVPLLEAVKNNRLQLSIELENGLIFSSVNNVWNKWWTKKRPWHEWLH